MQYLARTPSRRQVVPWTKKAWNAEEPKLADRSTVREVNPSNRDRVYVRPHCNPYAVTELPHYYEKHRYSFFDNRDPDLDNSRS